MRKQLTLALATLSVAVAGTIGLAQIKALTLNEMVDVADGAIHGQIVGSDVFRIDDPVDVVAGLVVAGDGAGCERFHRWRRRLHGWGLPQLVGR